MGRRDYSTSSFVRFFFDAFAWGMPPSETLLNRLAFDLLDLGMKNTRERCALPEEGYERAWDITE